MGRLPKSLKVVYLHSVSNETHHKFVRFTCDPGSRSGDLSRSYFIMRIRNRSQKTPFENVKLFSRHLEECKDMSCFGIRKTAQIPLWALQIWYFFQMMHFFWQRVHGIESRGDVPRNVLEIISYRNIKWHGTANRISETISEENCQRFRISQFSWVDMHSNILKTVGKWWGILEWRILHVITRSIVKMMYEPCFTQIHSQREEMQLSNFL